MAILNPFDNPRAWDTLRIANVTSPGLVTLSGFKRANEWDIKKGKGSVGGTLTFVQRPPAKGTFTFRLWLREHFTDWDTFQDLFEFDPSKTTITAVDIYHPALAKVKLKSLVTENIGAIEYSGKGKYTVVVDVIEYLPPPKKSVVQTPSTSKYTQGDNIPGKSQDPVADKQQQAIADLLKEAGKP